MPTQFGGIEALDCDSVHRKAERDSADGRVYQVARRRRTIKIVEFAAEREQREAGMLTASGVIGSGESYSSLREATR
jgi:hypothetical protein